jgi:zinc/manganese transport system permease protein
VATALILVMLLGVGALCLSMTTEYFQSVYALLFGQILGIAAREVAPIAVASVIAIAAILLLFRPLLLTSVSPDLAAARGISAARMELCFLVILALATAMALPVVGALLVFSLMVGPASAARAITDRPVLAMSLSAVMALMTVWAAIAASYWSDWPVGFFVGALGAVNYLAGRVWRRWSWRSAAAPANASA